MSLKGRIGKLAYDVVKAVRFWPRPVSVRSRCLVIDGDSVLLVRNLFGEQQWTLPGGDIKPTETAEQPAIRELQEELAIEPEEIGYLGKAMLESGLLTVDARIFLVRAADRRFTPDKLELLDARWFPLDGLPEGRSPLIDEALKLFRGDEYQPAIKTCNI